MAAITIVTGCPGSGKTTLAAELAARSPVGVHIVTDKFYHFLAHPIDPTVPESKSQNTVVIRAFLSAALSFADGGFEVFLDGLIGPWWGEEIKTVFDECQIVCLHADEETVLSRVDARGAKQQPSATSALVSEMHRQFSQSKGFGSRTIITTEKSVVEVISEFDARSASGDFAFP